MPFGAFVQVGDGIEGLVHISEMAGHHVDLPEQVVTPGEELWVKIIDIDLQRRRISLSIKQAAEGGEVSEEYREAFGEHAYDAEGNYIGPSSTPRPSSPPRPRPRRRGPTTSPSTARRRRSRGAGDGAAPRRRTSGREPRQRPRPGPTPAETRRRSGPGRQPVAEAARVGAEAAAEAGRREPAGPQSGR